MVAVVAWGRGQPPGAQQTRIESAGQCTGCRKTTKRRS